VPDELARALGDRVRAAAPRLGRTRLVCVDGPAGSGKTTLADALGVELDAQVVHLDDLYQGWGGLPSMLPRLRHWVLDPLVAGRPGRYRRWDWDADAWAEWHDVPVADALVVEGVGAAQAGVRELAVLTAWVEAPWELRLRRGVARDGGGMRPEWERWQAAEAAHFAADGTAAAADVVIDGASTAVWRARDR
jgi:chloramphenicol 3-O-phosphotransferase